MTRGLGAQQIWVMAHLRSLDIPPNVTTTQQLATARFGFDCSKSQVELIRQTLHRLHRDGMVTVERRGRELAVTWVDREMDTTIPNALQKRAEQKPIPDGEFARRMRARRGASPR